MILITGATGFLGKNLLLELASRNEKTRCLARKTSDIKHIKNFEVLYGDMADEQSLVTATKGVDVVVHLAALINAAAGGYDSYYEVNVVGARNLIAACRKNKVKQVVVISSMAATRTYLDDYGRTKLEADELFLKSGLDVTILRPSLIYGRYGSKALDYIVRHVRKFPFIIPVVGDGNYTLSPVYVGDVVSAIIAVISNKKACGKIYDVAGKNNITFNEFIDVVCKKFNIRKTKLHVPLGLCLFAASFAPRLKSTLLNITENTKADITQAQQDFGYGPINFKEGIRMVA